MITDWKNDLLAEKSLRAAYAASKKFNQSVVNNYTYLTCGLVIALVCVAWLYRGNPNEPAIAAKAAADVAFDLTVQILGFLIGGFAIFATVSDSALMIRLSQAEMKSYETSVFKYIFFNFLAVFYIYIITLSFSCFIKLCDLSPKLDISIYMNDNNADNILTLINSTAFFTVSMLIVWCIVRLKSFIWNIYQAFVTALITSAILASADECPTDD